MSDAVVIDLSNYKDRVGSRVTPNRYRVRVEDVESDKSSNGNPMINLWLRIEGGEFDGQTLVDRLTITEKSLFRVVGFMSAIGLPTPKKRIQIDPRKFLGSVLDVDVDDGEPYNGRVKSEVRGYVRVPRKASAEDEFDETETEAEAGPAAVTEKVESAKPDAVADEGPVDLDELDL